MSLTVLRQKEKLVHRLREVPTIEAEAREVSGVPTLPTMLAAVRPATIADATSVGHVAVCRLDRGRVLLPKAIRGVVEFEPSDFEATTSGHWKVLRPTGIRMRCRDAIRLLDDGRVQLPRWLLVQLGVAHNGDVVVSTVPDATGIAVASVASLRAAMPIEGDQ